MKTWRTMYKNYTKISKQSGWGWDYIRGHTDVSKEIWDEFDQQHPECKSCARKSCPIYDDLYIVFNSNMATGVNSQIPQDVQETQEKGTPKPEESIPVFSTQLPPSIPDFKEGTGSFSPCNVEQIFSRKAQKRARPHVESSHSIAKSMNEISGLMKKFVQQDDLSYQKSSLIIEIEQCVPYLMKLEGLTRGEKFVGVQLLEDDRKRTVFLSLETDVDRIEWVQYNVKDK